MRKRGIHSIYAALIIIGLAVLNSCDKVGSRSGDARIAKVGGNYLYESDLASIVPPGTNAEDSSIIVARYIDNWVRQQIFLIEAKANLSKEEMDFDRKVQDYLNSLIIFTYENKLVSENLDTVITPQQLAEYYESHKSEFRLRDNIVQINYIKVPLDAPELALVRRLITSDRTEDLDRLEEYAINHAAEFFLNQDSWFKFTDILRDIPLNPANTEIFLRNNRFVELSDQYYRYFLYIRNYKLQGSESPLSFQVENIRALIINHRRQAFINEFRENALRNANQNQTFEVFE